jgi:hypothetical protein
MKWEYYYFSPKILISKLEMLPTNDGRLNKLHMIFDPVISFLVIYTMVIIVDAVRIFYKDLKHQTIYNKSFLTFNICKYVCNILLSKNSINSMWIKPSMIICVYLFI